MACYLIAYDLNLEKSRPEITKRLKANFGTWAMLSESAYAVVTDKTAATVYNLFADMLDSNDQLYVITLTKPYAGFGPEGTNEWLDKYLPA